MANRLAGVCALVVFAICLMLGIQAGNSFSTTLSRALVAMAGTFGVGLAVGWVAQKMLDENLKTEEERLKSQSETAGDDR
jgi:NhaP-type Na+/H+ or K+/H+ antiporter